MRLCLPLPVVQALARLRLGWARLEVRLGRQRRPTVPRAQRLCRLCSAAGGPAALHQAVLMRAAACGGRACVEDTLHFLLECPAYDAVRSAFGLLPAQPWAAPDSAACVRDLFAHASQVQLARMVYAMCARCEELLSL
jgi:hypothetical protein